MLSIRRAVALDKISGYKLTEKVGLGFIRRFYSDDLINRPAITSSERARSVTAFYFQVAIDNAAKKSIVRLMPSTMLYSGRSSDGSHLLRSAQYLHKELPIRLAHCITAFRQLPFIVGCNPSLLSVHELYISSFHSLSEFPAVNDFESESRFSYTLMRMLDDHKDVVSVLAEGFKETMRHISNENLLKTFLDMVLTSRLAMRILCEHHLQLHVEKSDQIGVIHLNFSPKAFIEKKAQFTRSMCDEKYGLSPEVHVRGQVAVTFPYIPQPLDYIINELLKNAMRAVVESHPNTEAELLPPVVVTLASNETDFITRVSDMGGGVPHEMMKKIWNYGFTTSETDKSTRDQHSLFEDFVENRSAGRFYGYGFGLPACRAFVEYLGGKVHLESMQGMGTDVYVRLSHINGKTASFRV